ERALEEQHRRQPDRDRQARERDRPPGGGHGGGDRALAALAARELVAEAVDDEQRVVDRDAEPDQGDDVDRVLRHVREAVERERAPDAADDGQDADAERQAGGDEGGEDQDQQQQRHRQRHRLRSLQVGLQRLVEGLVDGHEARAGHRQHVGRDLRPEVVVDRPRLLGGGVDLDDDERLVTVGGREAGRDRDREQDARSGDRGPAEAVDESTPACEHLYLSSANTADSDIAFSASTASSALKSGSIRFWTMIPSTAASTTEAIARAGFGSA